MAGETGLYARDFADPTIIRTLHASADGILITIPYNTEQTHQGRFFFANFYDAAVEAGTNIDLLMVTGATYSPHVAVMCDMGAESTISIYEAVTASSNGTELSALNANRVSANAATASVFHTPTVTDTGTTLLLNHYISGGGGGNATGGSSTDFARITELVLKLSTKYLFRVTNQSNGAVKGSAQLGWFEDV